LLISAGADVTCRLKNGVNSLHLAAQSNNVKAAHYLISQGFLSCDAHDH
jgi:ankyrin repeat protein